MIVSDGVTPGAVFANVLSWRTTNVYVVGLASSAVSQSDCVCSHAFAATNTSFAVHELSCAAISYAKYGFVIPSGPTRRLRYAWYSGVMPSRWPAPQFESVAPVHSWLPNAANSAFLNCRRAVR